MVAVILTVVLAISRAFQTGSDVVLAYWSKTDTTNVEDNSSGASFSQRFSFFSFFLKTSSVLMDL